MSLQLFFERLRSERERLCLTQDQMVVKTGVSKRSYCAYESGETAPSAKLLAALVVAGLDVSYLLTGNRNQPQESNLSARAKALLANYEATDDAGKKHIETAASLLSQRQRAGIARKA
jgi:transcriptional regulator with XRE-family HTH domain